MAILNGGLREYYLLPILGAWAQPISGIILILCIFAVSYIFIPRLGPARKQAYITMGIVWVFATLMFETLIGHIAGAPASEMLAAYNILSGNLWLLIVIFIGLAPSIVAKMKGLAK